MARIVYDYYKGKDIYNDGDVEDELLKYYKDGKEIDFFGDGIWYLTTDIRSNILEWYPFQKTDSILEVGSGSGTMTSILCDRAGKVTSIEGSKRRAEITYERNKKYKNLEVIAGNYGDFSLKGKYDYIVLIGVFEYAKRFFPNKDAFVFFLETMKRNLKKDGKVLIAIENRYGIKYWAGAKEDHLLKPYVGLEGYESTDIGTFGKAEFVKLINRVGFSKYKFYYPFPDYKLPEVIYSDDRLPELGEVMKIPIYLYNSKSQFEIYSVLRGLRSNDIIDFFANSYIVEFGFEDCKISDIDLVKYQNSRKKGFKISTVIKKDVGVIKKGLSDVSKKHLERHYNIHKRARKNNLEICDVKKDKGSYISDYIYGQNFSTYIGELLEDQKFDKIVEEIDKLYNFMKGFCIKKKFTEPITGGLNKLYKSETFIPKMSLMDFNSSNIIISKNGYILVDQEWVSEREIPLDYMISNSLYDIFTCNPTLSLFKEIDFFLDKYGITREKTLLFEKISKEFFHVSNHVIDLKTKRILDGCQYKKSTTEEGTLNEFVHLLDSLSSTYYSKSHEDKMSEIIRLATSYVPLLNHYGQEKKFFFSSQTDDILYLPNKYMSRDKGSILLLIHELSRTGAPVVLADTARVLYDAGYFVTVLSLVDGPLRDELLDYGIPVIISEDMHRTQYQKFNKNSDNILLDRLIDSFDRILMCTATLVNFVRRYGGGTKEIIWWLHEGPESWKAIGHLIPYKIGSNIKVLCGGQYVIDQMKKFGRRYKCSVLNYGVEDRQFNFKATKFSKRKKLKFFLVGTICERKGQLILLEAIKLLPTQYRDKGEFIFIGSPRDNRGEEILLELQEFADINSNIQLISDISRDELYELYKSGGVLVVPSFDDPMPVVATENFMFGNICICSDMTGTSYHIEDRKNGFVFETGNAKDLSNKILYIMDNLLDIEEIRQKSRAIYDENFSMGKFTDNILKIIGTKK